MNRILLARRTVLQTTAATALVAPFVHGAYAAGKLSFGVWDHWVPGAAEELKKICAEWAAKEKVDLNVDLITSNGDKDLLTLMAEGQAKAGHDMMGLRTWYVSAQADNFVPVDDIVLPVIKEYGPIAQASEYTGKIDGHWMAVPTSYGNGSLPPCARIDYMKEYVGLDIQKMYPAGAPPDKELVELVWLPITEARRLDMPGITAIALEELQDRMASSMSYDHPAPLYRMLNKRFVREVL